MNAVLLILLIAVALLGNALTQMMSHRLLVQGQLVASLLIGIVCGLLILAAGLVLLAHQTAPDAAFWWHGAAALLIYLSASFTFLIFVSGSQTSVRLEILRIVRAHEDGITLAQLDDMYSDDVILRRRLDRLLGSGKVTLTDGRYRLISPALLCIARVFRACRLLIYGVASGFDLPKIRHQEQDELTGKGKLSP